MARVRFSITNITTGLTVVVPLGVAATVPVLTSTVGVDNALRLVPENYHLRVGCNMFAQILWRCGCFKGKVG